MFSEKLKILRKEYNLSQEKLAQVLNISKGSIGMYETNRREPSFEILLNIADFFNVSLDYLLGRKNNDKTFIFKDILNLEMLKTAKEKLNYSYDQISELSNVPRRTVVSIFTGQTKTPRIDTLFAIKKALKLETTSCKEKFLNNTEETFIDLFNQLSQKNKWLVLEMIKALEKGG